MARRHRQAAGIFNHIAAIHRGFSTYKTQRSYRNQPNWIIPIELLLLLSKFTHFLPTQATLQVKLVAQVAQKAMQHWL